MKKLKLKMFLPLILVGALVQFGCKPSSQQPSSMAKGEGVNYLITFTSNWTPQTHPFEYPKPGILTGPHFSGLIGASHNDQFSLFKEGTPPTPGLEHLSEEGKHHPLDDEIRAAIKDGKAMMLFENEPLRDFSKSSTVKFQVNDQYPLVSFVAMIAPSPDWFTGITNVNLKEGGEWIANKTIQLYAWDSGGDDGTTYEAADIDTNPKKPTTMAMTPHFVINGQKVSVATVTFTKQ
jgi:hypothetical protein